MDERERKAKREREREKSKEREEREVLTKIQENRNSPCGQRKRSINKDVNRMLTAANCMMKGPQLSMEEAYIQTRRGECKMGDLD